MSIEYIPATLKDLTALHKLEKVCFEDDAWGILDLIAVLTMPRVIRTKAVDTQKRMIGFVAGDPRMAQDFSWVATIGVLPEYRRQGVGRKLLQLCEEQLPTKRVRLAVRISNEDAIQLYRKTGYQTINIWQSYYNDGTDAVVMEKKRN